MSASPFTCRVCDRSFQNVEDLSQHHQGDSHNTLTWRCKDICGRAFEAYDELCYHRATAPLHHVLNELAAEDEFIACEALECVECDALFFNIASCYRHFKYSPQHNIAEANLRPYGPVKPEFLESLEAFRAEVARRRRGQQEQLGQAHGASLSPSNQQPTQPSTSGNRPAPATTSTPTTTSPQVFGPPTLEEAFNAMAADFAAMKAKLQTTADELEHQKSRHRCGMCYESEVNCVTECGHQFCLECVEEWRQAKPSSHPTNTPCPMCRSRMGKVIRTFTCEV